MEYWNDGFRVNGKMSPEKKGSGSYKIVLIFSVQWRIFSGQKQKIDV
jgi:hypothetical protein